jgi:hypothetical protein
MNLDLFTQSLRHFGPHPENRKIVHCPLASRRAPWTLKGLPFDAGSFNHSRYKMHDIMVLQKALPAKQR